MSNDFDWKGLAEALTYAHCEAQGIEVTRSSSGNGGSPVKTPLEVVHIPINASNSVAAESLSSRSECLPLGEHFNTADGVGECGNAQVLSAVHSESERLADSSKLPTAQVNTCSQTPLGHADGNGAVTHSVAAPEKFEGKTIAKLEQMVERIEATLTPLQVAILDAEMRARRVDNFSVSSEIDPAEDSRFA